MKSFVLVRSEEIFVCSKKTTKDTAFPKMRLIPLQKFLKSPKSVGTKSFVVDGSERIFVCSRAKKSYSNLSIFENANFFVF